MHCPKLAKFQIYGYQAFHAGMKEQQVYFIIPVIYGYSFFPGYKCKITAHFYYKPLHFWKYSRFQVFFVIVVCQPQELGKKGS